MPANKTEKQPTLTKETRYGYYIQEKYRQGKKRKQKTTRITKNPEKVILGKLGDIEFYAYPYTYPDRVFIGLYPLSTTLEESQKEDILRIYNRIRWFFNEEWIKDRKRRKGAKVRRRAVVNAYNAGLKRLKETK